MHLEFDSERVEFSEDGELQFAVFWKDVQRVTAWRNYDPGYERYFVSLEIVPDPKANAETWTIYYVPAVGPDEEWLLWTNALSQHIPGFTVEAALQVLDLPEDSDENCIQLLVRGLQERSVRPLSEEESWLDEYYDAHVDAFTADQIEEEAQQVFVAVYNVLAEVQNGGFEQYFGNSTGDDHHKLRVYLKKINAQELLQVVDSACSVFPRKTPGMAQPARARQLDRMSSKKREQLEVLSDEVANLANGTIRRLRSFVESA